MISSQFQYKLAGCSHATQKVTWGRNWYQVELSCGITVRVNPRAKYRNEAVVGNNALVALKAIEVAEGLPPKSKLGKMLREWASKQSCEGKAWVKEHS